MYLISACVCLWPCADWWCSDVGLCLTESRVLVLCTSVCLLYDIQFMVLWCILYLCRDKCSTGFLLKWITLLYFGAKLWLNVMTARWMMHMQLILGRVFPWWLWVLARLWCSVQCVCVYALRRHFCGWVFEWMRVTIVQFVCDHYCVPLRVSSPGVNVESFKVLRSCLVTSCDSLACVQ